MLEKPDMYKITFEKEEIPENIMKSVLEQCFHKSMEQSKDIINEIQKVGSHSFGPYTSDIIKTKTLEILNLTRKEKSNNNIHLIKKGLQYVVKVS